MVHEDTHRYIIHNNSSPEINTINKIVSPIFNMISQYEEKLTNTKYTIKSSPIINAINKYLSHQYQLHKQYFTK